jgi:YgiT-type zinc finger domain-containing protein
MGTLPKDAMKCRVCGGVLHLIITDLPFKVSDRTIAIVKTLPILQCERCSEYSMEDFIFVRVEELLLAIDTSAELKIIPFAA